MWPRLSVIVPAHNEAARIARSLERIAAFAAANLEACELLVVDDGSTDGTADVVRAQVVERVRVLRHERRRGKGAAVRTGVAAASEPWLLFVDADLSVPIEELVRLLPAAARAPIVIGSKRMPGAERRYPLRRRLGGWLGHVLISVLVVPGLRDTQCGFKLFRTDVARELFRHQRIDGFGFDFEVLFLARRLGYPIIELPVRVEHAGASSVSVGSYLAVLGEIATLLWNRACGRYPRGAAARPR